MANAKGQEADWTVSRCFRILRPIASRKAIPRTEIPEDAGLRPERRSHPALPIRRPRFGDSPNPRIDPDWMAKPQRLAHRKYARPAATSFHVARESDPGKFSLPTPIIARVRGTTALQELDDSVSVRDNHRGRWCQRDMERI
jgi:hypothetical protein